MSVICFSSLPSASTWTNSAISGVQLDLGLHRRPTDDAPGIVDAGVGEADLVGWLRRVLAGVDVLGLERLHPRLIGRAFRLDVTQPQLLLELLLDEEFGLGTGGRRAVLGGRQPTAGDDGDEKGNGRRHCPESLARGETHRLTPLMARPRHSPVP